MELYTLNINVNKQRLSFGENKPEIFSGDQSIDFVEFTFEDDMWNFPDIWAIFSRFKGTSYQVALEDNKVMIPAEVMQNRGYVYIGLMATDGENVQTSNVLQYSIGQGSTNVDAITPSASIYEQFLADLDAYQTAVADLDDIESRITTAEGNVSMIEQAVTDLNEQLGDINVDISTINGQITTIQNNIGTAQGDIVSIQNGINTLNGQVEGLDTAVGTLSNRVTALQSSVTSLEGRLTTVGNTLTDFEGRLTTAGTTLTNLEGSISDAENDIQTVQGDIETIQSDIEDIQTAIEQNNVVTDVTAEGISLVDNHIADLSFMCVTDTASGDVASFPDGSGVAMKKAEVSLEPIQDLHGYDKPWVGGGGKNKLPPASSPNANINLTGVTATVADDGSITLNGTATATGYIQVPISTPLAVKEYTATLFNSVASTGVQFSLRGENVNTLVGGWFVPNAIERKYTFTPEAETYFWQLQIPDGTVFSNFKISPMLVEGNTVTSYEPYSNICPIDGYEDVGLYSDSKYGELVEWNQLVRLASSTSTQNGLTRSFDFDTNALTIVGTATANTWFQLTSQFSLETGHVYILKGAKEYDSQAFMYVSANGNKVDQGNGTVWRQLSDMQQTVYYIIYSGKTMNTTFQPQLYDLTKMFGSELANHIYDLEVAHTGDGTAYFKSLFPKDYYAYNAGETMTVGQVNGDETVEVHTDLGRTVYGGTVDLASGVLTVDKAIVDLGTLSWSTRYTGNTNKTLSTTLPSKYPYSDDESEPLMISDRYLRVKRVGGVGNLNNPDAETKGLYNLANSVTGATEVVYLVVGVNDTPSGQLCYKLATPQTYQLTPQQIQTLIGTNNVWSEDGAIEVEYIANLKDYIDKKINA